jgi:polysaccharide biosynthesis transport protein
MHPEYIFDEVRRACLELRARHPKAKSLLVTAPVGGEGTTTIACLFGKVMAEMNGASVAIVDANLRAPSVHRKFSIPIEHGLRDWDPAKPNGALRRSPWDRLLVMSAGAGSEPSIHHLHQSGRLEALVERLKQEVGYVIWDTPPMNLYPDAGFLLPYVDGVLIVVEADATRVDGVAELQEQLAFVNASVLGVIINRSGRYFLNERRGISRHGRRLVHRPDADVAASDAEPE